MLLFVVSSLYSICVRLTILFWLCHENRKKPVAQYFWLTQNLISAIFCTQYYDIKYLIYLVGLNIMSKPSEKMGSWHWNFLKFLRRCRKTLWKKVSSAEPSFPIKGTLEGVHIQDHPDHLKNQHNRLPGTSLPMFASCSSSSGSGSFRKFLYQHHHQCHQQKITIAMLSSVVLDPDINQSCWCFVMKNYAMVIMYMANTMVINEINHTTHSEI